MYYSKRIFQLVFTPDRTFFAISARCFHILLDDILLNYSIHSDVGNFCFNWSLNLFVTPPIMTSACDLTFSVPWVTWSDYWFYNYLSWGREFKAQNFLICKTNYYICYDLHCYMFRPIICYGHSIKYKILFFFKLSGLSITTKQLKIADL
jgi:hypothetical protein